MPARPKVRSSRRSGMQLRQFSVPVAQALSGALASYDPMAPQPQPPDDALKVAIALAAQEARSQRWKAEELVSALRSVASVVRTAADSTKALEAVLKRRALVAYFGANDASY